MASQRVFVSHSHQDNAFCREYVNGLRARGAAAWYDEHNLGWGALRATIEREMPQSQHFVAILSPAAVASEWVNAEIDAALELLKEGTLQTLTFVLAAPCTVPLLLRRWKRIEGPGGAGVSVSEAVARTAAIIGLTADTPASAPAAPAAAASQSQYTPSPATQAHIEIPVHLEQLGFVGRRSGTVEYIVPPLAAMPAGEFLMGSDPRQDSQAGDAEKPQHRVTLAAYQIARYPVTVAEYACCVRAGGRSQPADWQQQLRRLDHPVVSVSWHDAAAYAAWLAGVTGHPWRLPTEAEWEKAARGTDGRIYPWGNTWDRARANTRDGGPLATTSVGAYAERGDGSPYNVHDLAGNVWEWTSSVYKSYPYRADDGRERADSTENRVLRGGSWDYYVAGSARAACRYVNQPGITNVNVGFRVVCAVPSS